MDDENEFPKDVSEDETDASMEELPPITTLHIDCTDARGIRYQGSFVFKVPNMRDNIEIGRRKSLLLPVSVVNDPNAIMLAEMIAYLDVTLQKGEKGERLPKWWKPLDFYDETPIVALYEEATRYAKRFLGIAATDRREATRDDEEQRSSDDRSDVDGDVSPPVERRTVHVAHAKGSASASASRRSSTK